MHAEGNWMRLEPAGLIESSLANRVEVAEKAEKKARNPRYRAHAIFRRGKLPSRVGPRQVERTGPPSRLIPFRERSRYGIDAVPRSRSAQPGELSCLPC